MKNICHFMLILTLATSSVVVSHTRLLYSTPLNGTVLTINPNQLKLEFSGKVRLLKLEMKDASGHQIDLGFKPNQSQSNKLKFKLPSLPVSNYSVTWTLLGADMHKVKGSIQFTIAVD